VQTIVSRQHPFVKRCRAAAARRGASGEAVLLDGVHLVRDALEAGLVIDVAAVTSAARAHPEVEALVAALGEAGVEVLDVTSAVMDAASPVTTPAGLLALAESPAAAVEDVLPPPAALAVAVIGVQDPGNVGAVIRSADAAGASGVLVCDGSADPFGWKALRGSMGSAFRIPVAAHVGITDALTAARARQVRVLAAVLDEDAPSLFACDLTVPTLLLLGGEGQGVPRAAVADADGRVRIPMTSGVDALNVAVAAGVLLFEARRQRSAAGEGHR
jgi:TrmH family RNA methyltransferase